jgi:hypothetical protein
VAELPPSVPLTSQLTLVLFVPDTDAVNCSDFPTCKVEELGEIETLTNFLCRLKVSGFCSGSWDADPNAQRLRKIPTPAIKESWGILMGQFCSTLLLQNKITKGHTRSTSLRYMCTDCSCSKQYHSETLWQHRLQIRLPLTACLLKQKTSGQIVRWP